jgi:hypothetical protein
MSFAAAMTAIRDNLRDRIAASYGANGKVTGVDYMTLLSYYCAETMISGFGISGGTGGTAGPDAESIFLYTDTSNTLFYASATVSSAGTTREYRRFSDGAVYTPAGTPRPLGGAVSTSSLRSRFMYVIPYGGSNGVARGTAVKVLTDESSAVTTDVFLNPVTDAVLTTAPNLADLSERLPVPVEVQWTLNGGDSITPGFGIRLPGRWPTVWELYSFNDYDLTGPPLAQGTGPTEVNAATIQPRETQSTAAETSIIQGVRYSVSDGAGGILTEIDGSFIKKIF